MADKKHTPEEEALLLPEGDDAEMYLMPEEVQALPETMGKTLLNLVDYDRAHSGAHVVNRLLGNPPIDVPLNPIGTEGAPSSSEMLEKAGKLTDHPFLRGAAGFGLDMISSPSSYGPLLPVKALAKLASGPGIEAARYLLEKIGKKSWKEAFKKLDIAAFKKGYKEFKPSNVLMDNDVRSWSQEGIHNKLEDTANTIFKDVDKRVNDLQNAGTVFNPEDLRISQKPLLNYAQEKLGSNIPDIKQMGRDAEDEAYGMIAHLDAKPEQVVKDKIHYRDGVSAPKWTKYPNPTIPDEIAMKQGQGMQHAMENMEDRVFGTNQIHIGNQKGGALLDSVQASSNEAAKAMGRDYGTGVDGVGLAILGALGADPAKTLPWWLVKKGFDASKTGPVRSMFGWGLTRGMQKGVNLPYPSLAKKSIQWTNRAVPPQTLLQGVEKGGWGLLHQNPYLNGEDLLYPEDK